MDSKGQNWVKIVTDDEETLLDLAQVDSATRRKSGFLRLWMKSGREIDITSTDHGAPFLKDLWERLQNHANIEKKRIPMPKISEGRS